MTLPTPSVLEVLRDLIDRVDATAPLYLGAHAPPIVGLSRCTLNAARMSTPDDQPDIISQQVVTLPPSDLIICGDAMDHLNRDSGLRVLAELRNRLQARICLLAPEPSPWQFTDLLGLGFKRLAQCERDDQHITLYSYAIADYNFTRDWNNSRFWANPELFDKYWW